MPRWKSILWRRRKYVNRHRALGCSRATVGKTPRRRNNDPASAARCARLALQCRELPIAQHDLRSTRILLQMLHLARARNRQHHATALEQPRERDLSRRCGMLVRDVVQYGAALRKLAGRKRIPRNETD